MCDFRRVTQILIDGEYIPIVHIGYVDSKDNIYPPTKTFQIGLYMNIGTGSGYQFYYDGINKRRDFIIIDHVCWDCGINHEKEEPLTKTVTCPYCYNINEHNIQPMCSMGLAISRGYSYTCKSCEKIFSIKCYPNRTYKITTYD